MSTELSISLTPPRNILYGRRIKIKCTGHGEHISLKLVRLSDNCQLAVGIGNISAEVRGLFARCSELSISQGWQSAFTNYTITKLLTFSFVCTLFKK